MSESKWWVGQRVHACAYGDGIVYSLGANGIDSVDICFDNGRKVAFYETGKECSYHTNPTLFPIDTERPKPKEKKRIDTWLNIYPLGKLANHVTYSTEHEADIAALPGRLGPVYHIIHEWEE